MNEESTEDLPQQADPCPAGGNRRHRGVGTRRPGMYRRDASAAVRLTFLGRAGTMYHCHAARSAGCEARAPPAGHPDSAAPTVDRSYITRASAADRRPTRRHTQTDTQTDGSSARIVHSQRPRLIRCHRAGRRQAHLLIKFTSSALRRARPTSACHNSEPAPSVISARRPAGSRACQAGVGQRTGTARGL